MGSAATTFSSAFNRTTLDGGAGGDRLTTELVVPSVDGSVLRIAQSGGAGDDWLSAKLEILEGEINRLDGRITLAGVAGDDRISAQSVGFGGLGPMAIVISGGSGNDRITMEGAGAETEGLYSVYGGSGDDTIVATAHPNGFDTREATNRIWGGDGNDSVTASEVPLRVLNLLQGGAGDDVLTAQATGGASGGSLLVRNNLSGGAGDDRLMAQASGSGFEVKSLLVHNTLRGGGGDDRILGRIASETGQNRLYGGAGDDRLAAVGGSGNILDGGTGDDEVRGSTGTDTFVFDLVAGSADTDRPVIFDGAVDRLQFLGVSDEGAPGLIDDLDAVLRVIVDQPGGDLVLGFGDDRRIVFRDLGTGAIDSIADLVDDPAAQLIPGNADLLV